MAEHRLPIFYRYRLLWHLLFWVIVFVVYWFTYAGFSNNYAKEFFINLNLLPARIIGTYTLIYLILPFATEKKKFATFSILVLFHSVLYGFLIYLSYYITNPYPDFYDYSKLPILNIPKILTKTLSDYALPLMAAAIVIFKKWYADELKNKKLAQEKLEAEMNFLRAQVHPHFLFNTLNNLYGLTLIKSDKTSDVVLRLSNLLDYMIYKSNDDFVPLSKELEILEGYIELEKMRYNERLDFKYEVVGDVDAHEIAPLILLPFIENSFKHGASNDRAKPSIHINIEIEPTYLLMNVVNSIPLETAKAEPEGIGLVNVKRRLELIYPDQHQITIKKEDQVFLVELKIFWKK